ncbi:MAG: hypothetical protein QOG56_731 [Solirubrobacteraceae bacterium]|nr:hypothetical protein [Solirubrobacteraceae bacterium]
MHAARRHVRHRRLAGLLPVLGCLALPVSAHAGRLVVTGHDADAHCIREAAPDRPASCHFVATGVNWARAGAPDPTKPVLILDRANRDLQKSVALMSPAVPNVVVSPRDPNFATMAIDTATYSAVLIASSKNEASDLTIADLNELDSTPDSDAINARAATFASFFNAGGGIDVMSGGLAGRTNSAKYYAFLKLTRAGSTVSTPFTLTPLGRAIGWQDARAHAGELDSINCCDTHLSFDLPAPESPLKVAELDNVGRAVTMVAETNDLSKIEEVPTTAQAVFGGVPGVPAGGNGTVVVPGTPGSNTVTAKPASCVNKTRTKITLTRPKGVSFAKIAVTVTGQKKRYIKGKVLRAKSRKIAVTVKLRKGKTTNVKMVVTTGSGRKLTYKRSYKTCKKR